MTNSAELLNNFLMEDAKHDGESQFLFVPTGILCLDEEKPVVKLEPVLEENLEPQVVPKIEAFDLLDDLLVIDREGLSSSFKKGLSGLVCDGETVTTRNKELSNDLNCCSPGIQTPSRRKLKNPLPNRNHCKKSCNHCNKTLRNKSDSRDAPSSKFVEEEEALVGNNLLCCNICGKQFLCPSYLKKHKLVHTNDKPFKCEFCDKTYKSSKTRKVHQLAHPTPSTNEAEQGEQQYECDDCRKVFPSKRRLISHVGIHLNLKSHLCGVCGRTFLNNSSRVKHMQYHSEERPFQCEFCGSRFKTNSALVDHRRRHVGDKRHCCEFCDMKFVAQKECRRHVMQRHSLEKAFDCEFCDRKFKTKEEAENHRRRHTGEKRYVCELCGKKFGTSGSRLQHSKRHLKGLPFVFKCEVCSQLFQSEAELLPHASREHAIKYKCAICGVMVKRLKEHIRIQLLRPGSCFTAEFPEEV